MLCYDKFYLTLSCIGKALQMKIFAQHRQEVSVSAFLWRIFLCVVFLLSGSVQMMAQEIADAQLNVMLADVQSIRIDQDQHNVSIVLDNVAEISNGKVVQQADHLQITSSSEYEIKVSASSQLQGSNAFIPISTVQLSPSLGSTGGIPAAPLIFSDVNLSTNQQTLVQSENGEMLRSFNIAYKVFGGTDYLNKPAGTYTTTIIYSILPY